MKETIPLDAARSVQLEAIDGQCHVHLLTFGIKAMSQQVQPELLFALSDAANKVAMAATTHGQTKPACPPCTGNCNQGRSCPARG